MLTENDLFTLDKRVTLSDISLSLLVSFYTKELMPLLFHYFFSDGSDIKVEFEEWGLYHLLGIQHIDYTITKKNFNQLVKSGSITFLSFKSDKQKKKRFNDNKERMIACSCIYHVLENCSIFYLPTQIVPGTSNVKMDYILYEEISGLGYNIGTREVNGRQVPLTMLVDRSSQKRKHLDEQNEKIVAKLEIIDKSKGSIVKTIIHHKT